MYQALRGSPGRKRRGQYSTSRRLYSEAGRRKKVTEETRYRQSELGKERGKEPRQSNVSDSPRGETFHKERGNNPVNEPCR